MKYIPAAVANKFGRQLLHLQKHSPRIAFAGGLAAGAGSIVLACRSTLKLSETLAEFEEKKDLSELLHEQFQQGMGTGHEEKYDDKEYAKDQMVIKVKTVLAVTKLYAPAAGLAMLSVALLTGSHVTLNKRNASLTAAYAGLDKTFNQYRERVVDELGKDKDDEFRYGTRVVEEVTETADGKKKTVKKIKVADNEMSDYARFFDKFCSNWSPSPEENMFFLKAQLGYMNNLLHSRGHVFLNDVYDALGLERTRAGAVVGWVLDNGDNYIDFGIFDDKKNDHVRDFVNGRENSILLDFNVDGVIFDKI